MKICLISLIEDAGCNSLRYLSSYIRNSGHETKLIFLPRLYNEGWGAHESYRYPYSDRILNQLAELCLDSDIIGISLMSCHLDNAVHITKSLRKLNKPIIWGGIHPTINPQECLKYADMVCVGEGEHSIVELLNWIEKSSYKSALIQGILTQNNSGVTAGRMIENLDKLGFPDYDMEHQFILYRDDIVKLNKDILSECFGGSYRTSFSRGCTMSCSYCCNNVLKQLYGTRPIRWRSLEKQIDELKMIMNMIGNLKTIDFADDTFLSRPYSEIRDFAMRYRKEIGLPFKILTTPLSVSYDKIKTLSNAGLYNIGIGVQSAYEPVREMYKRHESIKQIKKASEIIKKVSKDVEKPITVRYDFITDNPWGGEMDTKENIKFAITLEETKEICIFSLVFYHGTELAETAKKEGIIKDELNEVYRVTQLTPKNTYMNEVFLLLAMGCPDWTIKMLMNKSQCSICLVKLLKTTMRIIWYIKNPNILKIKQRKSQAIQQFNGKVGELC